MKMDTAAITGIFSTVTLSGALYALATLIICLIVKKALMSLFTKAFSRMKIDNHLKTVFLKVIDVLMWAVIIITVCGMMGINVTSLVTLFSVVGLAFSLAIQDSLSNLASGIMILSSHPFKLGDYVEAGGTEGTVRNIGIIYTELCTPDNKLIHVPNSSISSGRIVNYSCEPTRRVDITVSASYDASTSDVRKALQDAISRTDLILNDPNPVILVGDYGDSAISYVVRVWVKNADYWTVMGNLKEEIRYSFERHNVEMTYNHLNIHMIQD